MLRLVLLLAVFRRRITRRFPEIILVLASIAASLLIAEFALRGYYRWRTRLELTRMGEQAAPEVIHTRRGQLGQGVRLSNLPNIIYELRPNLRGTYDGRRFRSDRYGFREDRKMWPEKRAGVRRIVGIGDSWMWGSGVDNGQTYLDRLYELFAMEGAPVEVINTGVWGYNARQQVATLRWKGLVFAPDVVVIGLCGNDREYTSFLDQRPFVETSHSLLWDELSTRLRHLAGAQPKASPERALMPFSDFIGAYAELFELSRAEHFSVVVFSECFGGGNPPEQHPSCRLGGSGEWREFTARLDAWGFYRCPWDISRIPQNYPHYGHATVEGNRILASILAECVRPLLVRTPDAPG